MRVAAVGDVHAPLNFKAFRQALNDFEECDVLLFTGDMVSKSNHAQLPSVISTVREVFDGPIVACFGNEEYQQDVEGFKAHREIEWLDDQSTVKEIGGLKLGIVGTRGSLDRPTFWQRTRVPAIAETYRNRVKIIDGILADLKVDVKVVISHYAPTYLTLEGEREQSMPEMASKSMEEVIRKRQPDVWFHGHIHKSKRLAVEIGRTLVMDVSLPAKGKISTVELPRKTGLEKFL